MSFSHYKVEGYDKPLRLSEAHAKQINAERVNADGSAIDATAPDDLKGEALEAALRERGLPVTGTADEKRAAVAEYDARS